MDRQDWRSGIARECYSVRGVMQTNIYQAAFDVFSVLLAVAVLAPIYEGVPSNIAI